MGYLGRRIGKSQNNSSSGDGVDGNLGGGILDLFAQGYFAREGNINRTPGAPPSGHVATGGVISDYTAPDGVYRAHIFTSSGTFDITAIGNINSTVEYLVVAGGGGGGAQGAGSGGGGAGGLRTNLPGVQDAGGNPLTGSAFPVSVATYTVTVGAGGDGGTGTGYGNNGSRGSDSYFGPPSTPNGITATGGGGGGATNSGSNPVGPGGSGGGRGGREPGSAYTGNTPPSSPSQGNAGGTYHSPTPDFEAGGGGGAGAAGTNGGPVRGGAGGVGVQVAIAGPAMLILQVLAQ